MKIVKILGGLGNQMFQYALSLSLREQFPHEQVMIDTSCFRNYPLHNGFEIDRIICTKSPRRFVEGYFKSGISISELPVLANREIHSAQTQNHVRGAERLLL